MVHRRAVEPLAQAAEFKGGGGLHTSTGGYERLHSRTLSETGFSGVNRMVPSYEGMRRHAHSPAKAGTYTPCLID